MKKGVSILAIFILLISCNNDYYEPVSYDNPQVSLNIPFGFPELNNSVKSNVPTKYGVELGEKLFQDKRLSADNSISCSSCHIQGNAFADNNAQAVGIENRLGLRNVPAIQNMMFLNFYNWDGNILQLENQPLV